METESADRQLPMTLDGGSNVIKISAAKGFKARAAGVVKQSNRISRAVWPRFKSVHTLRVVKLALQKVHQLVEREPWRKRGEILPGKPGQLDLAGENYSVANMLPSNLDEHERIVRDPRFHGVVVRVSKSELRRCVPGYATEPLDNVFAEFLKEARNKEVMLRGEVFSGSGRAHDAYTARCTFFPDIAIEKNELLITFGSVFASQVIGLTKNYNLYQMSEFTALSRYHYQALFDAVGSYAHIGFVEMSLADLREVVGLTNGEYPEWSELRRRVVQPFIAEVNKKTSFKISFRPALKDRSVIGVKFDITRTDRCLDPIGRAVASLMRKSAGMPASRSVFYIRDCGVPFCQEALAYLQFRKSGADRTQKLLQKPAAYLTTLLQGETAPSSAHEQFIVERERLDRELWFEVYQQLQVPAKERIREQFSLTLSDPERGLLRSNGVEHPRIMAPFKTFLRARQSDLRMLAHSAQQTELIEAA